MPAPVPSAIRMYARESRRPLVSLVYVVPLLAIYELGNWLMPDGIRNGADLWLRWLLDAVGFGSHLLLPVLTIALLLAWHHVSRQPWRVPLGVLPTMFFECLALGSLLILVAHATGSMLTNLQLAGSSGRRTIIQLVAYFGAGFYEEVMFRLLLLPAFVKLFAVARFTRVVQLAAAVIVTSLLFSLAHYVGRFGEPLEWYTFVFRFLAGVFFAVLFVSRGFGIAVGTHALYDIVVGLG